MANRHKRTVEQRENDLRRVAELRLQKHTDREIAGILFEETGIQLSRQQIQYDRTAIRKMWLAETIDKYDVLIRRELARIDALEETIWQAMRDSMKPATKDVVNLARRKIKDAESKGDGDIYEMVKVKEMNILETSGVSPAFFSQIQECQKERRRLLGLYAPQQIDVHKNVVVKGYAVVSPSDWDVVVEGEAVEVIE